MKNTIGLATILTLALAGCGGGGSDGGGGGNPGSGSGGGAPSTSQPTTPSTSNTASTIYNECTDPIGMTLPTGFSTRAVYTMFSAGKATGELITETVINGPAVFEGQNAIQISNTNTTTTFATVTTPASTNVGRDVQYGKVQNDGLVVLLGSEDEHTTSGFSLGNTTIPSVTTKNKEIYSKEETTRYLTLKLGESVDIATLGTRTTTTLPSGNTPGANSTTAINYTTHYTYVARETVNVSGRNFDTCKYTTRDGQDPQTTQMWLLVGNGTMVKTETSRANVGTMQMLLKSGTYNGVAL